MVSQSDVLEALEKTSRTFFIPIHRLPPELQEAVASAYLCMRAIDEIEDHAQLDTASKIHQLSTISQLLQAQTSVASFGLDDFSSMLQSQQGILPDVTLRIGEWACYAPRTIAPRIWDATATMADRMAYWITTGWKMETEADLDRYTFAVAGAVGLLLCDIWAWFGGGQMERIPAIQFGRGLQAVNILRNRAADQERGVDFFPPGWTAEHMTHYATRNLSLSDAYAQTLSPGPLAYFIKIPLTLAYATLDALAHGDSKLSRDKVLHLIQECEYE